MSDPGDLGVLLNTTLEERPLLDLGGVSWRPNYVSADGRQVVHRCETEEIGASIERRIVAALRVEKDVYVEIPAAGPVALNLSSQEFLLVNEIHILTGEYPAAENLAVHRDFATAVRAHEVLLDAGLAREVLARYLGEALQVRGEERGRALERSLGFGCSQIPGWKVRDLNFRNDMEEIDVVVANNSARSPWNGSAYVLVESKNWSSNVGRDEYDSFHMKVKERGGLCRLGLFVSATGFSSGFYKRGEHHGSEGFSIVPIAVPAFIENLNSGVTIEDALAERVERVVLDRVWEE